MKKTLRDINVFGKRVLVRVDFNVPLRDGKVGDDRRIVATLPTINYLRERDARVILISHLGRPKGKRVDELTLEPVARHLSQILGIPIHFVSVSIGPEAEEVANRLRPGEVMLLENIRFYPGEEKNDPEFARELAKLADIYVNDAFGTAHRAHASTVGVPACGLPSVVGFLMERELEMLGRLLSKPAHPFVAVLGGAKVKDKIGVVKNLLPRVDHLVIGGGMAFTFLKAKGLEIGKSLLDEKHLPMVVELLGEEKIVLPEDIVVVKEIEPTAPSKVVYSNEMAPDDIGVDIGPQTQKEFAKIISEAKTIFWNGPMGIFEMSPFSVGTLAIAKAISENKGAISVVGGGDSASAVEKLGFSSVITHISTGGGASLEFMEGKILPGVAIIEDVGS